MEQKKQKDWEFQWNHFYDDSLFLFQEWIYPTKIEDFKDKVVLDCGCGGGQHLNFIAPYVKRGVGIDLNTPEIARKNNEKNKNIECIQGNIATMELPDEFDIVYSIGVIHHTDDPTKSFNNIKRFVKKGGQLIIWVYAYEGNFLNRVILESLKNLFILKLNKRLLIAISNITTALLYIPIYSIYLLPLKFLPFYYYFQNFRKLSFGRNNLNVFDKLNAPQTIFIKKEIIERWFNKDEFEDIHISHYKGISWRASGIKK